MVSLAERGPGTCLQRVRKRKFISSKKKKRSNPESASVKMSHPLSRNINKPKMVLIFPSTLALIAF